MYFSVKKVVTASWQISIFPSVFSAPHLPLMVSGCLFWWFFFVVGIPTPLPKKHCLLQMFWKSVFWEVLKKAPVLDISRHVTYFSAVQHPWSVFFLAFLKCLGNDSCTNPDLHCFTLFSWPPGPQYVHQSSSFEIRRIWRQAVLALGNKIIKWAFSFFSYPPPASLFQRHSKNNLYIEWTEVFLLQKSSLFHMDCRKGFLDICPIATFWPVGKQATDSVFVWLLILQSSGTALFATCIHNFFSNQFFKTLIWAHGNKEKIFKDACFII